ncbi:MAG TPA: carboxypeptidase-like regulatory domain-containing protein, partial [Flavobacterium sp.]|nr:carboxypeptidase-like regulatory domain-containing protein [Flavobacterium sp.]
MKPTVTLFFLFICFCLKAQVTLSGKVMGENGKPLAAANVYIDGTYDGTTTDVSGNFSFETTATGNQVLVIT